MATEASCSDCGQVIHLCRECGAIMRHERYGSAGLEPHILACLNCGHSEPFKVSAPPPPAGSGLHDAAVRLWRDLVCLMDSYGEPRTEAEKLDVAKIEKALASSRADLEAQLSAVRASLALAPAVAALDTPCVCGHMGDSHRREEETGAARECKATGCGCTQFGNVWMAFDAVKQERADLERRVKEAEAELFEARESCSRNAEDAAAAVADRDAARERLAVLEPAATRCNVINCPARVAVQRERVATEVPPPPELTPEALAQIGDEAKRWGDGFKKLSAGMEATALRTALQSTKALLSGSHNCTCRTCRPERAGVLLLVDAALSPALSQRPASYEDAIEAVKRWHAETHDPLILGNITALIKWMRAELARAKREGKEPSALLDAERAELNARRVLGKAHGEDCAAKLREDAIAREGYGHIYISRNYTCTCGLSARQEEARKVLASIGGGT